MRLTGSSRSIAPIVAQATECLPGPHARRCRGPPHRPRHARRPPHAGPRSTVPLASKPGSHLRDVSVALSTPLRATACSQRFFRSSLCLLTGALSSPSHRRVFADVFLAELCLTTPFLAFPAFRMHLVRQCLTRVATMSDQLERQALSAVSKRLLVSWHWSALRWSLRVI